MGDGTTPLALSSSWNLGMGLTQTSLSPQQSPWKEGLGLNQEVLFQILSYTEKETGERNWGQVPTL